MNWFRPKEKTGVNYGSGLYKVEIVREGGWKTRMHLRVESDLNGVLWLNGNESFYLNASAALFTWCVMKQLDDNAVKTVLKKQFGGEAESAFKDYLDFKPLMEDIANGKAGACDLCESGIDTQTPFSKISDAPFRMDLALTYKCNNRCAHCYNEPGRANAPLGLEDWEKILQRINEIAVPHVVFTGGEPTLVPFLPELLRYTDELGIVSGLNTNGRQFKDIEFCEKLKDCSLDHAQVTLESHIASIHDAMVCAPGAWEETTAGIRNAVKAGIYLNTNTTLLANNATKQNITDLVNFINDLGVRTMGLNALIYSGRGKNVGTGLNVDQLPELLEAAKEAVIKNGMRLLWYTPTPYCLFDPYENGLGFKTCSAARYSMCVEPDGSVLPCQSWYQAVGNILSDPWESIWNAPLCRSLREREYLPQKCRSCESKSVCGCGCPMENSNNEDRVVPRCGLPECF